MLCGDVTRIARRCLRKNVDQINAGAAFDGVCVERTSVNSEGTRRQLNVRAYKQLWQLFAISPSPLREK
jgi:hypothetical protein